MLYLGLKNDQTDFSKHTIFILLQLCTFFYNREYVQKIAKALLIKVKTAIVSLAICNGRYGRIAVLHVVGEAANVTHFAQEKAVVR